MTHALVPSDGQIYLRLRVPKNALAADLSFVVEATSDPVDPSSWSTGGLVVETHTPTLLQVRDFVPVSPGVRRFMRVRVITP
jgi:hypothetical protein